VWGESQKSVATQTEYQSTRTGNIKEQTMNIIYLKLLKPWGQYKEGETVRFGESKGRPLIAKGIGVEVKAPKKEELPQEAELKVEPVPEKKPEAETATLAPGAEILAETADVTPRRRGRPAGQRGGD
jgi:hypothetical protein